jgi:fumarate hydratase class II
VWLKCLRTCCGAAQTQRSLEHFSIGKDLIPREMITAYAILKKAAATANHASERLDDERYKLIVHIRRSRRLPMRIMYLARFSFQHARG